MNPTTLLALVLAVLVALGGLLGGVWSYGRSQYSQGYKDGGAAVATTINSQAGKQAVEAEAAREPAFAPGSLERLRRDWCRDCQEATHVD